MSCEVHLVIDPEKSAQLVPWRVVAAGQTIQVELPGSTLGTVGVIAERESARLYVNSPRPNTLPRSCDLDRDLEYPTSYGQKWMLPDGGFLIIDRGAWRYPTGRWLNR